MYNIPWPSAFMSFISSLRLFLIDVVSITKASCARPMTYYDSLVAVLVGTKVVLLLLILGPWLWHKLQLSQLCFLVRVRQRRVPQDVLVVEEGMVGRRRASVLREMHRCFTSVQRDDIRIDWMKMFRTTFVVLFVAYPGENRDHTREHTTSDMEAINGVDHCSCSALVTTLNLAVWGPNIVAAGVSLKIMRLFRCVEIEGVAWLAADMRLQCYTAEWTG